MPTTEDDIAVTTSLLSSLATGEYERFVVLGIVSEEESKVERPTCIKE